MKEKKLRLKKECEVCHKKFRKVIKCKDGKRKCGNCKRRAITNKWYMSPEKLRLRNQTIGKFMITDKEKNLLHQQFIRQGLDSTEAWRKVNNHTNILRKMKRNHYWNKAMEKTKETGKNQQVFKDKKKFLEGLK